jgi:hypothetical protein
LPVVHSFTQASRSPAPWKTAEPWSLISLREKLIKIGAKVVSHGRDTDQFEMFRCNAGPK